MKQISHNGSSKSPSFSQNSPNVKKISLAGFSLFNDYGIRRVTVEEICRACGVSKRTFYQHFKNKIDLILHILEELSREYRLNYEKETIKIESYQDKIMQGFLLYQKFSGEFSADFYSDLLNHPDEKIKNSFENMLKEIEKPFLHDFLRAGEIGDVRPGVQPEFILYMLNLWKDLLSDEKLHGIYPNPRTLSRELFEFFHFGIFPRQ